MKLVVDASITIKLFTEEVHSAAAEQIFSNGFEFHAPELIIAEMGSIVWKKEKQNKFSSPKSIELIQLFLKLGVTYHGHADLIETAYEGALRTGETVYDWLYLACAIKLSCPFVTADKKFYEAIKKTPFKNSVWWIEEVQSMGNPY